MMLTYFWCAVLAPVVAHAAAFPWALPEPTVFVSSVDVWSPAPTKAPQLPAFELFRRQQGEGDNTCGFVSGLSDSSITCSNTSAICATNTYFGVQGCCDPSSMSACTIPTTCIASTAVSTACTDGACSSNAAIVKCTGDGLGECYKWLFVYPKTTMTQHGCAASGFTSTAQRSLSVSSSSLAEGPWTITVTALPATTSTTTPSGSGSSKPSIRAIVGGTVGGCVALSAIAFGAFMCYRRRQAQRDSTIQPETHYHSPPMTKYSPMQSQDTEPYGEEDYELWQRHQLYQQQKYKLWQQQQLYQQQKQSGADTPSAQMLQYPGMTQEGIVEMDGVRTTVEAPT